jgi:hypothetical protein
MNICIYIICICTYLMLQELPSFTRRSSSPEFKPHLLGTVLAPRSNLESDQASSQRILAWNRHRTNCLVDMLLIMATKNNDVS